MGLRYCPNCQTVEGETQELPDGETGCAECDSEEPIKRIPEHDDYDMER